VHPVLALAERVEQLGRLTGPQWQAQRVGRVHPRGGLHRIEELWHGRNVPALHVPRQTCECCQMQQLTALDTQFLAIESANTYGHVSGLAILDPSTAPGGEVTLEQLKTLLEERMHPLPPLTRRLATVPFGL